VQQEKPLNRNPGKAHFFQEIFLSLFCQSAYFIVALAGIIIWKKGFIASSQHFFIPITQVIALSKCFDPPVTRVIVLLICFDNRITKVIASLNHCVIPVTEVIVSSYCFVMPITPVIN